MQRTFTLGSREFTLRDAAGTVKGARTSKTTQIRGAVEGNRGNISSSTTVRREIWFTRSDTGVDQLLTTKIDVPVLEGQQITAIGITTGRNTEWVYLFNHNSRSWWQLMHGSDFLSKYYTNVGCCGSIALSALLFCVMFLLHSKYYFTPLIGSSNAWMYSIPLIVPVTLAILNSRKRRRRSRTYIENLRQILADLGLDDNRIY